MNAQRRNLLRRKIDAGVKTEVAAVLPEHRRAGHLVAIQRAGHVVLAPPKPSDAKDALILREEPPKP